MQARVKDTVAAAVLVIHQAELAETRGTVLMVATDKAVQVAVVQVRPLAVLTAEMERLADLYFYIRREL